MNLTFAQLKSQLSDRNCWNNNWNLNSLNKENYLKFIRTHQRCIDQQCFVRGEIPLTYGTHLNTAQRPPPNIAPPSQPGASHSQQDQDTIINQPENTDLGQNNRQNQSSPNHERNTNPITPENPTPVPNTPPAGPENILNRNLDAATLNQPTVRYRSNTHAADIFLENSQARQPNWLQRRQNQRNLNTNSATQTTNNTNLTTMHNPQTVHINAGRNANLGNNQIPPINENPNPNNANIGNNNANNENNNANNGNNNANNGNNNADNRNNNANDGNNNANIGNINANNGNNNANNVNLNANIENNNANNENNNANIGNINANAYANNQNAQVPAPQVGNAMNVNQISLQIAGLLNLSAQQNQRQEHLTNAVQNLTNQITNAFTQMNTNFPAQDTRLNENAIADAIANLSTTINNPDRIPNASSTLNSSFFTAPHLSPTDNADIFNYVESCAARVKDRDLSLTKKVKAIHTSDLPTWNRTKYPSCLNFLWKEFHKAITRVTGITPFEASSFIYLGFDHNLKDTIMRVTSVSMRGYVQNELDYASAIERGDGNFEINGYDVRENRFNFKILKLVIYPEIAQQIDPGVLGLEQDPWDFDSGVDLKDYFVETLNLIQIENSTQLRKATPKELSIAFKNVVKSLQDNDKNEIAKALLANPNLRRVQFMKSSGTEPTTLSKILIEIEDASLIASPLTPTTSTTTTAKVASVETTAEVNLAQYNAQRSQNSQAYLPTSGYNQFNNNQNGYPANQNGHFANQYNNYENTNPFMQYRQKFANRDGDAFGRPSSRGWNRRTYMNNNNRPFTARRERFHRDFRPKMEQSYMNVASVHMDPAEDEDTYDVLAAGLDFDFVDKDEINKPEKVVEVCTFNYYESGFITIKIKFTTSKAADPYVTCLLDCGSQISIIKPQVLHRHNFTNYVYKNPNAVTATGFNNAKSSLPNLAKIYSRVGQLGMAINFVVGPTEMNHDVLLGMDILEKLGIPRAIVEQCHKLNIPVELGTSVTVGVNAACQTDSLTPTSLNDPSPPRLASKSHQTANIGSKSGLDAVEIPIIVEDFVNLLKKENLVITKKCNCENTPIGAELTLDKNKLLQNCVHNETKNEINTAISVDKNENKLLCDNCIHDDVEKTSLNSPILKDNDTINEINSAKSVDKNNICNAEKFSLNSPILKEKTPFLNSPNKCYDKVHSKIPLIENKQAPNDVIVMERSEHSSVDSDEGFSQSPVEIKKAVVDPAVKTPEHINNRPIRKSAKKASLAETEAKPVVKFFKHLDDGQRRILANLIHLDQKGLWKPDTPLAEATKILQTCNAKISVEVEAETRCEAAAAETVVIPKNHYKMIKIDIPSRHHGRNWSFSGYKKSNLDIPDRIIFAENSKDTHLYCANHTDADIKIHRGQRIAKGHMLEDLNLAPFTPERDVEKRQLLYSEAEVAAVVAVWEAVTERELVIAPTSNTKFVSSVARLNEATEADAARYKKADLEQSQQRENDFNKMIADLDPKLKEVFVEYKDRFMGDEEGWNLMNIRPLVLPRQPNHPKHVRLNYKKRFTTTEMDVINDFLITSLSRGLITRSDSNILSPLLIVVKPGGRGYRVCCDYRQVNQKVFDYDSHAIPEISDIIAKVSNKCMHTCLDLTSAYWRAELLDDGINRQTTAFVVNQGEFQGVYHWNVLPFGPKAAVSLFSKIMDDLLRGLRHHGVTWYLDDITCSSGTPDMSKSEIIAAHATDLRRLFGRARATNLTFSIEKAVIAREYIEFVGLYLGQGKVKATEATIKKMDKVIDEVDLDKPVKIYQSLLGLFNYSRKFIPYFSKGHKEIRQMKNDYDAVVKAKSKSKDEIAEIREQFQEKVVQILKDWTAAITSTSLTIPRPDEEIEISTDASGKRIAYFCRIAKSGRVVEFGSREMVDCELNYTIMEKELLSMAEALEKLKHYTYRAPHTRCLIDNQCAVAHLTSPRVDTSDRAKRFILRCQATPNTTFGYVKTSNNQASDCLTRDLHVSQVDPQTSAKEVAADPAPADSKTEDHPPSTPTSIAANNSTPDTGASLEPPTTHQPTTPKTPNTALPESSEPSTAPMPDQVASKSIQAGPNDMDEICRQRLVKLHEDFCHLGPNRLAAIARLHFPLMKIKNEVLKSVRENCAHCQKFHTLAPNSMVGRMYLPTTPNEVIHLDHYSPSGKDAQHRRSAILSLRDSFSKFVALFPVAGYSHSEIIEKLRTWVMLFGPPAKIRLDHALNSSVMRNFAQLYGVELAPTPVYHPATNGQVERVHSDLRRMIPLTIERMNLRGDNFVDALPRVTNIINSTPHSVTKFAPESIHFSRSSLDGLRPEIKEKWKSVTERLINAQEKAVRPLSGPYTETKLHPGQAVWCFLNDKTNPVPATVIREKGDIVWVEKLDESLTRHKEINIHKCHVSLRL